MNKIFAVAEQEFRSLVRSKAFLISIVLLPLMMVLGSVMQRQLGRRTDTRPRRFAVIDPSGRWFDALSARAEARNQHLGELKHDSLAPFVPVHVDGSQPLDQLRLQLSDQVKKEQLFAFVEIPAEPDAERLRYYTEHPAVDDLPNWLSATVDDVLRTRRYTEAKLDDATIQNLQRHVGEVERLGLWTRDPDGRVHPAEKLDIIKSIVGTHRGTPDFSSEASNVSYVAIYSQYGCGGWCGVGGTSVSSPTLAGIVNAAGTFNSSTATENGEAYKDYANATKYKADWRDVTSGSNGQYQCKKGWEFCTGIGSPITYKGK